MGYMEKRTLTFNLRLTPGERDTLAGLAARFGLSIADIIRLAVRSWAEQKKAA